MHLFYLHGFASSPASGKAVFLAERLSAQGLSLHCPDLNEPDFATVTTSRMIRQVETAINALPPASVTLIGSSLGAFVALHLAQRARAPIVVDRLILLAPALDFGANRMRDLGEDGLRRWRESGWLEFEHHAYGETRRVHYELFADAAQYDSFTTTATVPTLILQGRNDEVVDPTMVERFAATRPHVRLVMLDDGHQLKDALERVWSESTSFLDL
jgi:pimeloyl-ACP methyl ester carboxylesterase